MGMHGDLAVDKRIHGLLALLKELIVQLVKLLHESLGSRLVHAHALRVLSLRSGLRTILGLSHLHLWVLSCSNVLGAPGLLGCSTNLPWRIHQDRCAGVRHGLQQRIVASPLLDRVSLQLHRLIVKVGQTGELFSLHLSVEVDAWWRHWVVRRKNHFEGVT